MLGARRTRGIVIISAAVLAIAAASLGYLRPAAPAGSGSAPAAILKTAPPAQSQLRQRIVVPADALTGSTYYTWYVRAGSGGHQST